MIIKPWRTEEFRKREIQIAEEMLEEMRQESSWLEKLSKLKQESISDILNRINDAFRNNTIRRLDKREHVDNRDVPNT